MTGLICSWGLGDINAAPLLIAPMGASAVLLFGVPASPLAQPWSIIGGNALAALIGVTAALCIPSQLIAAAVALGVAFVAMSWLRCIHPPSGAVALTAVLGGPHVLSLGYGFVLVPVMLNSVVLVGVAMAYNSLTGTSYPHRAHQLAHAHVSAMPVRLDSDMIDGVLADYGEIIDVGRDDLEMLFKELLSRMSVLTEQSAIGISEHVECP
ncbi:HPP family protein [Novosphingobium sp. 9]|uniref:HPP family protein n=1 Tax=Novosphingobium sp. 9 TaxID=2025349 RepID=UPI0021B50C59|nr:HPP family protein [Novosphingobium sp. 9]